MENYFNSQPHEEADDKFGVIPQGCTLFQLTASRRGWLRRVGQPLYRVHFNSQPHEEADADLLAGTISTNISTHSLTKRLTTWNCTPHEAYIISTHSLTKRLTLFSDEAIDMIDISTHSLTKRLTNTGFSTHKCIKISTHSLTKRLTFFFKLFCQSVNISTHSLTKRLTTIFLLFRLCSMYFNSQPHEEADWWRRLSWHWMRYFNSQPHEEADSQRHALHSGLQYFNSQPHEEADYVGFFYWSDIDISTHSLTKRLTLCFQRMTVVA